MKRLLLLALLLAPQDASAAKLISSKVRSYLPVFGIGATSSVLYSGTQGSVAITSDAGSDTELVRIFTTTATYIDIGTDPNPSEADMMLPANTEMILEIPSGYSIGAEDRTSGSGILSVTKLVTYPTLD